MKYNRCPWCGDASIPPSRRLPKLPVRFGMPEPCCPECEQGVMLSVKRRTYRSVGWALLIDVCPFVLVFLLIFAAMAWALGLFVSAAQMCVLVCSTVLVISLAVCVIRAFFCARWTRYRFHGEVAGRRSTYPKGGKPTATHNFVELCDIDTPYIITTEAPLSLRTESIYPVRLPLNARELFAGDVALNSEVVMHFECVGDRTYRAGFIRPDELRTEKLTADMSFTVWVDDDKKIVATIKKLFVERITF